MELSETRLLLQEDSVQQLIKEIEGIREKHFLTNNRQRKLDLEEQEDEFRERLKQELEIQRAKWVEIQQREIERKVDKLPKPEQREAIAGSRAGKSMKSVRKNLIPALKMPAKSQAGSPTTKMPARTGLIQNGCSGLPMGLLW